MENEDFTPFTPKGPVHGGTQHETFPGVDYDPRRALPSKPFAFALAHGEEGASIWHGSLLSCRTIIPVKKSGEDIVIAGQAPIPTTEYIPADNLDTDLRLQTHLGWYGNVYGYWEADDYGTVSLFDIRGPDEPAGEDISTLNPDLTRTTPAGKYYVLIGNVEDDSPVVQNISSDIPWFVTILRGESSGSSSGSVTISSFSPSNSSGASSSALSGSSAGSGSGSGSGGSSSKSTCIVPATWMPTRFTALFTMESPEVVFRDSFRDLPIRDRISRFRLDHRFIEVCAPGTIRALAVTSDRPCRLGVSIDGGEVVIERPWFSRDVIAQVEIEGIRNGFVGMRFPARDKEQFEANERTLNAAYPAKDL